MIMSIFPYELHFQRKNGTILKLLTKSFRLALREHFKNFQKLCTTFFFQFPKWGWDTFDCNVQYIVERKVYLMSQEKTKKFLPEMPPA